MLSVIAFWMILCSGSALAALKGKQFELFLPVTTMAVSIFLYWMGMLHFMKIGAILVCCCSALIYIYVGLSICKRNLFGEFTKSFFSPAFVVFFVLFLLLAISNKGKLAVSGDEFSCWMTRVK